MAYSSNAVISIPSSSFRHPVQHVRRFLHFRGLQLADSQRLNAARRFHRMYTFMCMVHPMPRVVTTKCPGRECAPEAPKAPRWSHAPNRHFAPKLMRGCQHCQLTTQPAKWVSSKCNTFSSLQSAQSIRRRTCGQCTVSTAQSSISSGGSKG